MFLCLMILALLLGPHADAAVPQDDRIAALRRHVQYVFVLFQENRAFDSYFGVFPGADGLFSDGVHPRAPADTPGFTQPILNADGAPSVIRPFRIGPADHAADLGDMDHSRAGMTRKMDIVDGHPRMDRFALEEERRSMPPGARAPSLAAKQAAERTMAYVDCDTIPFLWRYAWNFTLFDHIFQTEIGPSAPNAVAVIAGQAGETQRARHPDQTALPLHDDSPPFWGSPDDPTATSQRQPTNPRAARRKPAPNLTFATLMLSLLGRDAPSITQTDADPGQDLADTRQDVAALARLNRPRFEWGWYQEGYDQEPGESPGGSHDAYIAHHNGPHYFGYVSNNTRMKAREHGLGDFFADLAARRLPSSGVFYVRGGYKNIQGLTPAFHDGSPDANAVQRRFLGDDDHPGYADSEISEALVARAVNAIARSPYWSQSVIVILYDESGGAYDHEPPALLGWNSNGAPISRGPRIPLIVISPYARAHSVQHGVGDHNALLGLIELVFGLPPLEDLPDERWAQGARDARPDARALLAALDPDRLEGRTPPIPAEQAEIPDEVVTHLPHENGQGCRVLGITPEDRRQRIKPAIPPDFAPRVVP